MFTSLGNECKVVCVKFLHPLHFLRLLIYSSTSREYPGHHASNFILFYVTATPQCISSCTLFITNFLSVSCGIIKSPLQITPCSYVLIICKVSQSWSNFPICFFILDVILLSTGSCLVSVAILSKDKTPVSTQCKNVSSNSSSVLSFDSL